MGTRSGFQERLALRWMGVAALYAAGGWLGSLLALPPGYASAFWLPAGIALVAVVVWGRRMGPAILLGSFLVNLYISAKGAGFQGSLLPFVPLALGLGLGATAQALVGGHLVRRFVGYPTALLGPREPLLFLGLGGPVACLISASSGVSLLALGGVIPTANIPFAWFSWFAGDTIGVLILVPLFLVAFGEPASAWRPRKVQVGLPVLLCVVAVLGAFVLARRQEDARVGAAFQARTREVRQRLQLALDAHLAELALVRSMLEGSPVPPSESQIQAAGAFLASTSSFQGLSWVAGPEGWPPAGRDAMARAEATGLAAAACGPGPAPEVSVFLPVSGPGGPLKGFLTSGLGVATLTERAVDGLSLDRIRFQLQTGGLRPRMLHGRGFPRAGEREQTLAPLLSRGVLRLGAESWEMVCQPSLAFLDAQRSMVPWLTQATGLLVSALLGWVLLVLSIRSERLSLERTREARADAQAWLEGIFNAATEFSIIATDLNGVIRVFSPGAERLLGYDAHELIGVASPLRLHVEAEIQARAQALSEAAGVPVEGFEVFVSGTREGRTEALEWTYVRKDGGTLPVLLVVSPILDGDHRLVGFLGIAKDIAQEKKVQAAMAEAREQALQASRIKGEFVANMSHELRTPMNAVLGVARLLGGTDLGPEQRRYLDLIQASSRSLLGILNDVLDFSKMEAGRLQVVQAPCRLEDVLRALGPILSVSAGEKDLEVILGVAPEVPGDFLGDPLRLQQVLVNLAGNAVKFTPKGELVVWIECLAREGDLAVLGFRVRDTGIGMTPEQQARVFSPFWQAEAALDRRYEGTGLGLVIARRLVELMGGEIGLESQTGVGSTFWFNLPVRVLPSAPRPVTAPLRILIVDDRASSREAIALCIRAWGWLPVTAASGEEALAVLGTDAFDVVLLDWGMPGLDGPATLGAMNLRHPDRRVPTLLMTRLGEGLGPNRLAPDLPILTKPVTASSLFDAINELLSHRLAPGEAPRDGRGSTMVLEGVNVLLVEDNLTNQIVAGEFLESMGAEVDLAGNGLEALAALRAHPSRYHLVLMDVQMPAMDGFTATRRIRDELGLDLPVIAMTAGVMAEERAECLAAGMVAFIAKPVDFDEMLATIMRNLRPALKAF